MTQKRNSSPETGGADSTVKDAATKMQPARTAARHAAEKRDMNAPPQCPLVVGIGASAGGQEALEQLFTAMPPDCGLSFVVVIHLPPGGPSYLAEILGRYTTMEVVTTEEGMELAPNRVQVVPAGRDLIVSGGRLRLGEPGERSGLPHPIDRLFRSLAAELKERAIAVVLSGFGMDGAAGVKAVRETGGIVIVQEPGSALTPAMPRSAIATGAADFVLPAEEIPAKIAEIARGTCQLPSRTCRTTTLDEELHTIFSLVRNHTGHDFSSYKSTTVMRRIERRMTVNDVSGIGKYIALLRENSQEAHALCQDILIGVTSFFRDPDAFATLRRDIIPQLFAGRDPDEPVRIWHACCATGEEVYSMAILIREYLDEERLGVKVQLFATDIDQVAVAQARAGLYGDEIEVDVGEDRLKTFFTRTDGRWQVAKQLREMIVFAHHSLIKDPPFSRLDLLVCRNFLIYLNPDMQKRLIALFHQVLKPGGFLFLGAAETVGRDADLFTPVDKKWKIFERPESGRRAEMLFPFTAPVRRLPVTGRPPRPAVAEEPSPGAVAEKLLMERYSPPCVVVNEKYEVVHVSTRANHFLEVPVGEPTRDILRMAREELRPALRAAIYKAFAEDTQMVFRGVKINTGGGEGTINVLVEPIAASTSAGKLAMVVFEPTPPPVAHLAPAGSEDTFGCDETSKDILIRQMEEQLRITHEQLQATSEQLESTHEGFMSANEELMSINEEFQSGNEELQSTNEELETSKEELQALNEELVTVNAELQGKVEELDRANSDMENLLKSSEIATIFLDHQMNIKGFTPVVSGIFNLIPSDIGRPFRHFAGKIDWPTFTHDAETVLAGQPFAEQEASTLSGERCYLKRIFPYRNPEGKIDGIVVSFIDITGRKRAESVVQARLRILATAGMSLDEMLQMALDEIEAQTGSVIGFYHFLEADQETLSLQAWSTNTIRSMCTAEGKGSHYPVSQAGVWADCVRERRPVIHNDYATLPHHKGMPPGHAPVVREMVIPILREERVVAIIGVGNKPTEYDATDIEIASLLGDVSWEIVERKRAEDELRESEKRYHSLFENMMEGFAYCKMLYDDQGSPVDFVYLDVNYAFERLTGLKNVKGKKVTAVIPGVRESSQDLFDIYGRVAMTGEPEKFEIEFKPLSACFSISVYSMERDYFVAVFDDITDRKQALEALAESEDRVRRKLESIISPEGDIGDLDLADIIDAPAVQSLVDDFYKLTGMPMGLLDIKGKVLVGVGWQDICTKFHRVNPETCANCIESDVRLSAGIPHGEYKVYKCKNNLWDVATPVMVGNRHFGNLFMGQFFFEDEPLDYELFRSQAGKYGFDEQEYIAALETVPRLSRETLDTSMSFFMKLADILSQQSYSNLKLARSLTERDALMGSLRESEERFRNMFERHKAVMLLIDPESGVIVDANAAAVEFYGSSRDELCSLAIQDINQLPSDEMTDLLREVLREQRSHFKAPHRLANGEVRWVEVYSTPIAVQGKALLFSIIHDITEREWAEEELQKAHNELELRVRERTAELATTVETLLGEMADREQAEGSLQRLNRLYAVLSETGQAIVHAADREALFRDFCRIAVEHGGFLLSWVGLVDEESSEVRMVAASGDTAYLDEIRITADNEPTGEGPTGISIREGTYYICNDFQNDPCTRPWHEQGRAHGIHASASIALKEEERVIGALTLYAGIKDFFDHQHEELLRQLGADISFALDNLSREARRREAELALQAETLERLRATEELREKEQLLMQQSRLAAMGEMIGNIAHQWRQPLNTLGLIIQELPMIYAQGPLTRENLDNSVAKAKQVIYHMSQTIDDFRNFFRPDKEKTPFKINDAIARTIPLIEGSFREQRITIATDAPDDIFIHGYPNEYSQVILNILVNARDAFVERPTDLPRVVLIRSFRENSRTVLTITDSAGGIAEEILGKIFDPYFTTKGPDKGTGVGLFMSKIIIEKNMNGILSARNSGDGAEFRIEV
jgi:two-component system CheB/CheR fusion protein